MCIRDRTDEYEKEISIHTTATSKDGEKTILAGKEVTIVDTVKLDGLTKGTKYQLKGWQMLKEENTELIKMCIRDRGHLTVEGEDAYCIDINTDFRNGYKTRADARCV